ncbi:hypothetical protein, conserved [Plasmodium gonderi]|uniref:CLAMP domain-containing protein n=1 Tax=Plasmodium gonderi TaxID=77519 RepID=A0A1Y1JGE4_PLAGO|nr:hypothetical protein, conserved [Plasmodium gonderi]GAW81586.1 hypothetical protein, conserved [Plasmodium gonderi]
MNKVIDENGKRRVEEFLTCSDISKHNMRKIIVMNDKRKQKMTLLKKLNIHFNSTHEMVMKREKKKKIKLIIDNFLPIGLNGEMEQSKKFIYRNVISSREGYSPQSVQNGIIENSASSVDNESDVYHMSHMKRKKMKKILYDFFYNTLIFCIKKNLSVVEISTYMSIQKNIFFKFVSGNDNVVNLFSYFKNIMLHHSINRSPNYVKVFSYSSLKLLMKYTLNTFFKHFFLYKFIFRPIYQITFEGKDDEFDQLEMAEEICFNEDALICTLDTHPGRDHVRELVNLSVGEINDVKFGESREDVFAKELLTYLDKFQIQKEPSTFEINKCKKNKNLQKLYKRVENYNQVEDREKKGPEKYNSYRDSFTREKMDNLYNDLEARIIHRLSAHLG